MKAAIAIGLALMLLTQPAPYYWGDGVDWVDSADYEESQAMCRAVRHRTPPAEHLPPADTAIDPESCDSGALYYGLHGPEEPVRARHCAFREAEADEEGGGWPFAGKALLMTIYANGEGVERDLDLAIRYACEIGSAPAEAHGRVMHLAQRKSQAAPEPFHYCDDVTSGLRAGQCASFAGRFDDVARERRRAQLTAAWPEAHRAALGRLDAAFGAFEQAVVEGEVDMKGTLRMAMAEAALQRLRDEYLEILEHLESSRALPYPPGRLQREDARLNAVYREVLAEWRADAGERCCGAPTAEGLRAAQRAWLRYRDAFLALAALRYPSVPRDALAAWLTALRATRMGDPVDTGL